MTTQTQWGTHSLTKAILLLMEMALEESLNQRFVLLSESDIPLYPPAVVWLQLMSEQRSRIHACSDRFVSAPCIRTQAQPKMSERMPDAARMAVLA